MKIKMRSDLAKEGYTVPAGLSYQEYDDLIVDFYLSEDDLVGAEGYDNGVDTDEHAFCVVKLQDGRVVYMIGADLDWEDV
jgi:hypothetical protein